MDSVYRTKRDSAAFAPFSHARSHILNHLHLTKLLSCSPLIFNYTVFVRHIITVVVKCRWFSICDRAWEKGANAALSRFVRYTKISIELIVGDN